MGIKFTNNASTNITHALTADATSVSVTPGTGDLFPSIVEGEDYFYATLAGNNGLEIVKVTKRVLDTMTVERAQDGTFALIFNQGDLFELRIVAADFEDTFSQVETTLEDTVSALNTSVDNKMSSYLPLSGGTLTGAIYADNTAIVGQYENGRLGFASSNGKAAMLNLFGRYLAGDYAGAAELIAENDANRSTLALFPDGRCYLKGNSLLTSAGGTITGAIVANRGSNATILNVNNTGLIRIFGGDAANTGANLDLYGGANSSSPGTFILRARTSAGFTALEGKTDGSLTWGGNTILTSAGGTINGRLTVVGNWRPLAIQRSADATTNDISLLDENGTPVGYIRAIGTSSEPTMSIAAIQNGSKWASILEVGANADGTTYARHNSKDILTSAGGTVNGGSLYLSGGSLRGLWGKTADNDVYFGCCEDATIAESKRGAHMLCRSRNGTYLPGSFEIKANGATGTHTLRGRQDDGGSLTWDSNPVLTLVASWNDDGGNWYRKYSDGWIEQGGRGGKKSSGTISFHQPFRDVKYTMTAGNTQNDENSTHTGGWDTTVAFSNYTTTSFRFSINGNNAFNWYACGY